MGNRKAKLLAPVALISVAVLAVSGGLASADGPSTGSNVHFYEADTARDGNLGTVILTGAITDHGTDHQGVADGGIYNKLVLSKGSFEINAADREPAQFPRQPRDVLSRRLGNRADPDRRRHRDARLQGHQRHDPDHGHLRVDPARLANGQCNTNATRYPGIGIAHGAGTISYK